MMNDFMLNDSIDIGFLKSAFPEYEFNLYQAIVNEGCFMTAISCCVANESVLEKTWSRINNLIGTEYQTKLLEEYSRWNIYLVFFMTDQVDNALKYAIENDTVFLRKIVCDTDIVEPREVGLKKYINDHILGKDIALESKSIPSKGPFTPLSSTTKSLLMAKLPLGRGVEDSLRRKAWLDSAILKVVSNEI
jgi:hypothetical protein